MDQNPYEAPHFGGIRPSGHLGPRLASLRVTVAFLTGVVIFQWICHALTALALNAYIMAANNMGPTARTLDNAFYGICCVSITTLSAIAGGFAGVVALRRYDKRPPQSKSKPET